MNFLSKNIRFLRKSRQWSQDELARRLEVKRSNIAAYESKNVEPRLGLILKMAKLFDVNMAELIHTDIAGHGGIQQPFQQPGNKHGGLSGKIAPEDISQSVLEEFLTESDSIKKMLEGFKIFYRIKKEKGEQEGDTNGKVLVDIDNFFYLMEHMVKLNESLVEALQQRREQ